MGLGAKVADKQDECQVADLEAAGDDAHICTLEVEASLQSGQNTYLPERDVILQQQPFRTANDIIAKYMGSYTGFHVCVFFNIYCCSSLSAV